MVLKKLKVVNFKGLKSFEMETGGSNLVSVYGTNASGKTSLADAISWLLYDKASTDEVGFSPKPKDDHGKEIHYLETVVDAEFDVCSFKKVLKEVWSKKRGSVETYFTGNTVEYYVNDVPVLKKQYDEAVAKLCRADLIPVLSQLMFFPERMTWQKRRELLMEVCGQITDEAVLESMPDLKLLVEDHSVDEFKAISKAKLKKANADMKEIPARIDEASRNLTDLRDDREYFEIKIKQDRAKVAELQEQIAVAKAGSDKASQVRVLRAELEAKRLEHDSFEKSKNSDVYAKMLKLQSEIRSLESIQKIDAANAERLINGLNDMELLREKLSADYKAVAAKRYAGDGKCPTCGQELPADQQEKLVADFNESKSKELTRIRSEVENRCSKVMIEKVKAEMMELNAKKLRDYETLKAKAEECNELNSQIKAVQLFEETDEYISLTEQIKVVESNVVNPDDLIKKLELAQASLDHYSQKLAALKAQEETRARIEELKAQLKQVAAEADNHQNAIDLCEEFTRTKVGMISDAINRNFTSVQFKLFQEQINGGLSDCCEVMVPGDGSLVEFKSANTAAKVNAGLEIIQTISNHFKCSLPVFVDNAESVVKLQPVDFQVIRLVVSESDPVLRVEINEGE